MMYGTSSITIRCHASTKVYKVGFVLPVCTPIGFIRLFGVVGQVLVKPNLLRDVNEEYQTYNLEEASVLRKIGNNKNVKVSSSFFGKTSMAFWKTDIHDFLTGFNSVDTDDKAFISAPSKLCGNLEDLYYVKTHKTVDQDKSLLELQVNAGVHQRKFCSQISYEKSSSLNINHKLYDRLHELTIERNDLDKQRSSSCFTRNLIYPLAMLLLLVLTSFTVLLVMQNTIELLIGIKALPMSSRVS